MYLKSLRGTAGEIVAPTVGATIGTMQKWLLNRYEDRKSADGMGLYRFHGVFTYLNPYLFAEESLRKDIMIRIGTGKQYRVQQEPQSNVHVDQNIAITIDEVTLWPVEED